MSLRALQTAPIFRIFDIAKAREFYVDYLGFTDYPYLRPGLERTERGSLSVCVTDPFGNQIRFDESAARA